MLGGINKGIEMKVIKTASGKKTIKISKSEWESIGKTAGWMKEAKWKGDVEIKNTGENTEQTVGELKKEVTKLKKQQEKYKKEHGGKASKEITKKLRQKNFAIRAKGGWDD